MVTVSPTRLTVAELSDAYLEHAEIYYRDSSGKPTSTLTEIKVSLNRLLEFYGDLPAVEFGPEALRVLLVDCV